MSAKQYATSMRGGFLSVMTIVIILALAVLSVLELSTARAMSSLSTREATMTSEAYEAEAAAQEVVSALDGALVPVRKAAGNKAAAMQALASTFGDGSSSLAALAPKDGTLSYSMDAAQGTVSLTVTTSHGRRLDAQLSVSDAAGISINSWKLTSDTTTDTDFVLYAGENGR